MPLWSKPLSDITEADLQRLVADRVAEGKTIDYKRDRVGDTDNSKKEFLYDLTSFANTAGGHLVFGVEENRGVPTAVPGLAGINPDQEIARLEQMARDGVRPSIAGLHTGIVRLANGSVALVIRIPRSWNPPHQVTYQKAFKFYGRDTNSKYQLDIDELRSLFSQSESVAEKVRLLRIDRVAKIAGGEAPVSLIHRCELILHIVPLAAFGFRSNFSLTHAAEHPNYFPPPPGNHPANWRVNVDGLLTLSNADADAQQQRAYVQVFRSGVVEAVASGIAAGEPATVNSTQVEAMIVKFARVYSTALEECGAELPMVVMASLIGVKGATITANFRTMFGVEAAVADRDQLHLTEAVLDAVPDGNQTCATALRPMLDQLANAAGAASSRSFDAGGRYLLRF